MEIGEIALLFILWSRNYYVDINIEFDYIGYNFLEVMRIRGKAKLFVLFFIFSTWFMFGYANIVSAEKFYRNRKSSTLTRKGKKARRIRRKRRRNRRVSRNISLPVSLDPIQRGQLVSIAIGLVGKRYRYGGAGPNSFDCSGLVTYCFQQVGVNLPHSSRIQFRIGIPVSRDNLEVGDLVFFGRRRVSHVGIYVGEDNFIHAPRRGESVRIQPLNTHRGYKGAKRL